MYHLAKVVVKIVELVFYLVFLKVSTTNNWVMIYGGVYGNDSALTRYFDIA